jgi:CheY-like chemotaxis protein
MSRHNVSGVDVLVVEDEAELFSGLCGLLEIEGYRVAGARDGSAALRLLRSGVQPSLVVLDLSMPVMDGWELCAELQADVDLQWLPVTVFSGCMDARALPERRVDAGYLEKPVDIERLLRTVRVFCGDAINRPSTSALP